VLPRIGEVDVVVERVDSALRDLAELVSAGGALHESQVAALDRGAKLGPIVAEAARLLDRLGEDVVCFRQVAGLAEGATKDD
jgi:hypothetical protein